MPDMQPNPNLVQAPVIQTMRRPWSEIKKELEQKDKLKANQAVNPGITEAIEALEDTLLYTRQEG